MLFNTSAISRSIKRLLPLQRNEIGWNCSIKSFRRQTQADDKTKPYTSRMLRLQATDHFRLMMVFSLFFHFFQFKAGTISIRYRALRRTDVRKVKITWKLSVLIRSCGTRALVITMMTTGQGVANQFYFRLPFFALLSDASFSFARWRNRKRMESSFRSTTCTLLSSSRLIKLLIHFWTHNWSTLRWTNRIKP